MLSWQRLIGENVGWKMVYNFLAIDEKTEKSTYIRSDCPYSVFEHTYSVSKQKPRDYPPWAYCKFRNFGENFYFRE